MPVQKGFERTPKTGDSQFGFFICHRSRGALDTVPGGRNFITLENGTSLRPFVTIHIPMRHTHRTIFHE
jgi:hypothetical protein